MCGSERCISLELISGTKEKDWVDVSMDNSRLSETYFQQNSALTKLLFLLIDKWIYEKRKVCTNRLIKSIFTKWRVTLFFIETWRVCNRIFCNYFAITRNDVSRRYRCTALASRSQLPYFFCTIYSRLSIFRYFDDICSPATPIENATNVIFKICTITQPHTKIAHVREMLMVWI